MDEEARIENFILQFEALWSEYFSELPFAYLVNILECYAKSDFIHMTNEEVINLLKRYINENKSGKV
jgi:hypothetical protein